MNPTPQEKRPQLRPFFLRSPLQMRGTAAKSFLVYSC